MIDNKFLFFCVIVLTTILIIDTQCKSDVYSDRIAERTIGGWPAVIEDHPYQVHLKLMLDPVNNVSCGGSIISPRFILTAAHCLNKFVVSHVEVRAGSTYSYYGGMTYTSKRFIMHPLSNVFTVDYDVALIELQTDMFLDGLNTRTVDLPPMGSSVQPGMNVVVAGWGATRNDGEMSTKLMAIQVPIISNSKCNRWFSESSVGIPVTSRMFCAGFAQGGIDSCKGDSGSAAVDSETGVQLGVVSWGARLCAQPRQPGVYADLTNSAIRYWIKLIAGV